MSTDQHETLRTEAAGPAHMPGLRALFEAAHCPCYCRFWHFEGTNNEWLDRCANAAGDNAAELGRALDAGDDEARGVVALRGAELVGWLKVAPARIMRKAYERRFYKHLPAFRGDREGVFLVGCALVHPAARKQGVATTLVAGAVRLAPAWGARSLEALPRRPNEPTMDEELWTGPMGAFTQNGFVEVDGLAPYPVLRRVF